MTAAVRLEVCAVRERDFHLEEDVSVPGDGLGDVLEAKVAGPVEPECPHGTKTTLRASRRR